MAFPDLASNKMQTVPLLSASAPHSQVPLTPVAAFVAWSLLATDAALLKLDQVFDSVNGSLTEKNMTCIQILDVCTVRYDKTGKHKLCNKSNYGALHEYFGVVF